MLHEYILSLKVSLKPQHMRIYKMRRHSTTEFLISWPTFSCSKPTIETLEKGAFTVTFEHVSHLFIVFL